MRFTYCPDCGTKLVEKEIGDEGMVPFCETCSKPWFDMFSTCVIALVINEYGEAALLRQNYLSNQYHNLVSGYMKPGESAEQTAIREIKEEIGVDVERLEPAETYWYVRKGMLMIGFFAYGKKVDLTLSGEVDEARWVPVQESVNYVHPKGSISHNLIDAYLEKMGLTESI